jgi:hypothetical protein
MIGITANHPLRIWTPEPVARREDRIDKAALVTRMAKQSTRNAM